MSVLEASSSGRFISIARSCSLAGSVFVVFVAAIVLFGGWIYGSDVLVRLLPQFAAMVPSTAILFLITGLSLIWRVTADSSSARFQFALRLIAAIVALVAALDLALIISHTATTVDVLFWPSFVVDSGSMSPATAMCFLLAAGCVALLGDARASADFPFVTFATVGLLIAMIALVGYAFDAKVLYQVSAFTAMALHTAFGFFILFFSMLMARPDVGWVAVLLAPYRGSAGARRTFPLIVLMPFAASLGALAALRSDLFDINFSFCLLAIITSVLLGAAVLQSADIENRAERRHVEAMEQLNAAVADRDLLLRELYHRVKNNLQQINALIHMETAKIGDSRAKAAFRATAGRVRALGTVHRLLISSSTISELSTATFLEDLCENVGASFDAHGLGIEIFVEADDIPIAIDVAIPLGMLVNEIVTNSLKHAFRGRSAGEIVVMFKIGNDGSAMLTISDNGIGIPEDYAEPNSDAGTGSRIIRSFVKQVRGAMNVQVDRGTVVTIRFPRGFNRSGRND